jgi:phosphatidylserine/phosphatidylglycerophosphate/cardiolipin synthase-like enzyme
VGTANFSKKALEANVENIVVLENKEIAKAIKDEFKRCSSAIPYSQSKWGEKQDIIR